MTTTTTNAAQIIYNDIFKLKLEIHEAINILLDANQSELKKDVNNLYAKQIHELDRLEKEYQFAQMEENFAQTMEATPHM